MSTQVKNRLAKEANRLSGKYGEKAGSLGSTKYKLNVVPSGILALDYAMGTGGWPLGHPCMVFGANDIGKSSIIGLSAIRNAQALGLTTGVIAVEPGFDEAWAAKHGVDPDLLVIARPDNGEIAFQMLYEWIAGDVIDFTLFDSIGAILRASEAGPDGKPNQGGASSLITWGVKNILQPCWKNNKGLILLNQQRQDMNSRIPGQYEPPGGEAIRHACDIRVHLRVGRERHTIKMDDGTGKTSDVVVGRQLVANIMRNKMSEGSNMKAVFDYYQMETPDHPVGIDIANDVINTAMRAGVIKKDGTWYIHPSFPKNKSGETKLFGRPAVQEFLLGDDSLRGQMRDDVLATMFSNGSKNGSKGE